VQAGNNRRHWQASATRPHVLQSLSLASRLAIVGILILFEFVYCGEPDKEQDATEPMTELRVVLTSPGGEPVVGAAVRPYAMRTVEQRGHGYWDTKKFGPTKHYLSDELGVAVIRYTHLV